MINDNILGLKLFRYKSNNDVELIRIIGIKSNGYVRVKFLGTSEIKKIKYTELIKFYTKLTSDGMIIFNLVSVSKDSNLKDTIVAYKSHNHDIETNIPSIVCRQNISDIYNVLNPSGLQNVGCCATPKTMPPDIPYDIMTACDEILYSVSVQTYIEDEIDDWLECINTKIFDRELNYLFEYSLNRYNNNIEAKQKIKDGKFNSGYVTTLRDLLMTNGFINEYYLDSGIIKLGLLIDMDNITNPSSLIIKHILKVVNIAIDKYNIFEYDKDIDLSKLPDERYVLLKDASNKMFIFIYFSNDVISLDELNFTELYKYYNSVMKKYTLAN